MPSPFPGMDPYLEGYLWPDVYNALASKIRQQLAPKLRPRYTARLEIYVVEDSFPESEVGILYPDVEVMQIRQRQDANANMPAASGAGAVSVMPAPLTVLVVRPVSVRLTNVEIRDTAQNVLVTCIEILSPVNKRGSSLAGYRQKRQRLYQTGIHLIELDFLRRGTRPFAHARLPEVPYAIALTRAQSGLMNIWPLSLQDSLPTIPIPLRSPEPDVALDLSIAMQEIYDQAAYDLSINYSEPPLPALSEADKLWLESLMAK
ncbi:DUF4058 family protein [Leptolyngbya sp. FACHB-261]|uniref:DUF4058 family protein n=1 Tax=Leptolyngbya sp. FACHB-261 TaxID=2692806 RepID=UPI001685A399|nr:DUF4058 family protein [Leptolyngbya sp. FACHB-261]MBD2101575.1 DUF4058 family protein [Leptolyngbya sp. FACHB-261]